MGWVNQWVGLGSGATSCDVFSFSYTSYWGLWIARLLPGFGSSFTVSPVGSEFCQKIDPGMTNLREKLFNSSRAVTFEIFTCSTLAHNTDAEQFCVRNVIWLRRRGTQ